MNSPTRWRAGTALVPCAFLAFLTVEARGQSAAFAVPAGVQQSPIATDSMPAPVRNTVGCAPDPLIFAETGTGVVWARGRGYKAGFDGASATIIPFFGSRAPRNFPIVFRAHSATVGGEALRAETAAGALRDDRVVRIDRSDFVELYELDEEHVEQRFVFDTLPRSGDLVLRIDVETELAVSEAGDALRFSNELGHVDYGQAFAVDANGARVALSRTFEDGAIVLAVPGSFVAAAALPLSIDPLVSFFPVSNSVPDELEPDISFDVTTNHYCAVWTEVFSASDYDAYARLMTSTGNNLILLAIDNSADFWATPRIANNNGANEFLVVAEVDPAPIGMNPSSIRGKLIFPATFSIGPEIQISSLGGSNRYRPDVGGDSSLSSPSFFCVVWQNDLTPTDSRIEMRLVTPAGVPTSGAVNLGFVFSLQSRPAIDSLGLPDAAAPERWTVTWQNESSPTDHDIIAREVNRDGSFLTPIIFVETSISDETEPQVSTVLDPISGLRYCLIVYQRDAGADEDVIGALISDSSVIARRNLSQDGPASTIPFRQFSPKVDSDGQHFLVGNVEIDPSGFDSNIWVSDYYLSAGTLVPCTVREGLAITSDAETQLALCSQAASAGAAQRYGCVWTYQGPSGGDIRGALWDGCAGGAATGYCFGDGSGTACPCSNNGTSGNGCASSANPSGANLASTGAASVGADTFVLHGSGMPPTTSCLYFQGTTATNSGAGAAFGDGKRCASGTVVRLATKTNSSTGASQYPASGDALISSIGFVPPAGATRFYQAWYRNAAAFCTSSTFNLTNGLQVVWAP